MTLKDDQVIWYILGGLLFILAGLLFYLGISITLAPAIILILGGLILILATLYKKPPRGKALTVFILGLILFSLTGSGLMPPSMGVREIHSLTRDQVSVDRLSIILQSSTGNIHVSFSEDRSLIYNITLFKAPLSPFGVQEVEFLNYTRDGWLVVEVEAGASNIDILVGPDMIYNFTLTTAAGNIDLKGGFKASMERLKVRTTAGNIHISLGRGTVFQSLEASSTVGNIDLSLQVQGLEGRGSLRAEATVGNINLDLELGEGIGCDVSARTSLGKVVPNVRGFTSPIEEGNEYKAQRKGYEEVGVRLQIYLKTSLGNIHMNLRA